MALAFNELVIQYGKAKKTDKVIEKFTKQLTKKVTFHIQDDSITPYIKEEQVTPAALKAKTAKPIAEKKAVKKEPVSE